MELEEGVLDFMQSRDRERGLQVPEMTERVLQDRRAVKRVHRVVGTEQRVQKYQQSQKGFF